MILPNCGGRFSYAPATCRALAMAARRQRGGLKDAMPVPAGGMMLGRVGEMVDFHGREVILPIGGALLAAPEVVGAAARAYVARVREHGC